MTIKFPYRITLTRDRPSDPRPRRGHPIARWAATLTGLGTLVLAPGVAGASTALAAASNGPVSATINVAPPAVKSVTVNISSFVYTSCSGGSSTPNALGFPSGICSSPGYQVTNGATPAQIEIQGADATAAGGANWTLCSQGRTPAGSAPAPVCPAGNPGQNQYEEHVVAVGGPNTNTIELSNTAQCDSTFAPNGSACAAAPANTFSSEASIISGPQSSTNTASSFSTTITYTAV